jgi:7-carboxy-7-deazaguanine synthase
VNAVAPVFADLSVLVQETFGPTVQGEGFWAGTVVDFIRLYGCPVRCPYCDTGYADGGASLPWSRRRFTELLAGLKSPRVVISGGEPFVHSQLPGLIDAIEGTGRQVSIETSGAFWQPISDQAWVTLSPKAHLNPRYPVQSKIWKRASEVKIVIENGSELGFYQTYLPKHVPIALQPEWEARERTLPLTLELLKTYPNYRLSVQLHKYIHVQ